MTRPHDTLLLLAIVAAAAACAGDGGVGPDERPEPDTGVRDTAPPPVLGSLGLMPTVHVMPRGSRLRLDVRATSGTGRPMALPRPIVFGSDAPAVATVDSTGVVAAIAPGTAVISATASSAGSTRRGAMTIHVVDTVGRDTLVLTMGELGWQPSPAHVSAGGTVRWTTRGSWLPAGPLIYLSGADGRITDSVRVIDGVATRTFVTADTIGYCSGSCWDPPEAGIIIVR